MSGHGAPQPEPIDAAGLQVVVVAGSWHDVITDGLIAGAQRVLDASGASWRLERVPGSFELPVAAKAALDAAMESPLAEGLRFERHVFAALFDTADQKEGMAAFREKRSAAFRNR